MGWGGWCGGGGGVVGGDYSGQVLDCGCRRFT